MATGGVFPASAFTVPVEFDQFLGTFDGRTRASLRALLDRAGLNLRAAGPALAAALRAAPPALGQASYLLRDLDSSETELDTLVRAGSAVTGSVQASDPGLGALITSAASTFDALAARAGRLEASLRLAPATLAQARATLARAQPTLRLAGTVTGRLAPGVRQVQAIARPVSHLLVTLERVGPDAVGALAAAHSATPALNPLLARLATTMPALGTIGSLGTTELSCIRPYTPDIVAFASDWGDFLSGVDGKDHYFRAQIQALLPALHNAQTIDSAQLKRQFPWISFAFPAPPGYAAGQPWLLPRCGEGASTLDPSQDPENDATAAELPPAPGGAR
jgi:phospholipid/cholesterol/gamma-HCH transport system substrate-binding protein